MLKFYIVLFSGRLEEAEKMLKKLRTEKEVNRELDGIVDSWSADASECKF